MSEEIKQYEVIIPLAGAISVFVDASDENEAMEKAKSIDWNVDFTSEGNVEIYELDTLDHICQGNVCYAPVWDIEAIEI